MPAAAPPSPRRILLIRLSAFGDVVIATALLHGLKRAHPDAEVDWLVQPEFAELLRTQTAIANVIVWERKRWRELFRSGRWLALWSAIRDFVDTLRQRDYDWVIDAQGLFKSRMLARLAGGRFRIGYDGKEPGALWMNCRVQRFPEGHPARSQIGSEHQPMADALELGALGTPRLLPPSPLKTNPARPLVLAPFTTRPQKHWPVEHWRELIRRLADRQLPMQLLGGPADRLAAEGLLDGFPAGAVDNRVGQTSYADTASLIAGARAVVGVDTGLTHLGVALGRPTVAIFGSTLPYSEAGTADVAVITLRLPCGPCARNPSCDGRWDCLRDIAPTRVETTLLGLLAQGDSAASTKSASTNTGGAR